MKKFPNLSTEWRMKTNCGDTPVLSVLHFTNKKKKKKKKKTPLELDQKPELLKVPTEPPYNLALPKSSHSDKFWKCHAH